VFDSDQNSHWQTFRSAFQAKLESHEYVMTPEDEETLFRVAVARLIQACFQRPQVAEKMRIGEYESEQQLEVVYVKNHKTQNKQPAYFQLTNEDRYWLDLYKNRVRPQRCVVVYIVMGLKKPFHHFFVITFLIFVVETSFLLFLYKEY
jgi:hypothetical protein